MRRFIKVLAKPSQHDQHETDNTDSRSSAGVVRPLAKVCPNLGPSRDKDGERRPLGEVGTRRPLGGVAGSVGEAPGRPARELRREATVQDSDLEAATRKFTTKQVLPKWFIDGNLLDKLASEHCKAFAFLFKGKRQVFPKREITIASACSGSAGEAIVAQCIQQAFRKVSDQGTTTMKYLFSCESSAVKRQWINDIYHATSITRHHPCQPEREVVARKPCAFTDIASLAGETASCEAHNGANGKPGCCPVPHCDIFICSTSCKDKDASRMGSASGQGLVLSQRESIGGSAQTFHRMMAYIETSRPSIVIYEMDEVQGGSITQEDIMKSDFASRGYEVQTVLANSSEFGLPQDRQRYWIVAVLVVASPSLDFDSRSIDDIFRTLRALITTCRREAPCASEVIYPHAHARLKQELAKLQATDKKKQSYAAPTAMAASVSEGVSWSSIKTPEILKTSPWFLTLSAQQRQCASYSLYTHDDPGVLLRDVQSSVNRVRTSKKLDDGRHVAMAVAPKQVVLVFTGQASCQICAQASGQV